MIGKEQERWVRSGGDSTFKFVKNNKNLSFRKLGGSNNLPQVHSHFGDLETQHLVSSNRSANLQKLQSDKD